MSNACAILILLSMTCLLSVTAERNIFVLAGQSNMQGQGGEHKLPNGTLMWDGVVPPESAPNPLILKFTGNFTWEKAAEPLHGSGIGPGMPFAHSLLETNPGLGEIGLVPCAVGGTSIRQWARGSDLYNATLGRARAAEFAGGQVRALLWYQGEADTYYLENANLYKERFQQFVSDFRRDLMLPSLPVLEVAIASGINRTLIDIVRDAQFQTAMEVENVKCVDAGGLQLGPDFLHLTTGAQVQLGKKLADAYLNK